MEKVVVAVFGKDRPGIVYKVSSILAKLKCNIEDISQTVLQGEFCGMFVVSLGKDITILKLQSILEEQLTKDGLIAHTKPLEPSNSVVNIETEPFVVVTIGKDKVGLIAAISSIMYKFGVNISNLKFVNRAPSFPDKTVTIYEVDIPKELKLSEFINSLKKSAQTQGLEITVQHKKIFEEICRI